MTIQIETGVNQGRPTTAVPDTDSEADSRYIFGHSELQGRPATSSSPKDAEEPPVDSVEVEDVVARARRACVMHRISFEGTDPYSVRVPSGAVEELVQNLTLSIRSKVFQIVPFSEKSGPTSFLEVVWRRLAQRGVVQRFYLVPSGDENRRKALDQIAEDGQHGLWSVAVPVRGWNGIPEIPMTDMWLIDDHAVVRREFDGDGTTSWLVSGHETEVRHAKVLLGMALNQVESSWLTHHPAGLELTDVMLHSAEMLHTVAQMSCMSERHIDQDGCGWYHGMWQYLRLFDMVSNPTWHAEFYATQLREEIHERGARKILISGTADYTTLAVILHAARDSSGAIPADLELHVIDLCQTPLLACQWYAARLHQTITLHQADITRKDDLEASGLPLDGSFDLIVSDAFLTRFESTDSRNVLYSWFHLLQPDGSAITTVRLHPRNHYLTDHASDLATDGGLSVTDRVDDFERRLRERATAWQGMLSVGLEDLSLAGRQYAERMTSHDLGDVQDMAEAFVDQQFEVVHQSVARVPGELIGAEYLRAKIRRPHRPVGPNRG